MSFFLSKIDRKNVNWNTFAYSGYGIIIFAVTVGTLLFLFEKIFPLYGIHTLFNHGLRYLLYMIGLGGLSVYLINGIIHIDKDIKEKFWLFIATLIFIIPFFVCGNSLLNVIYDVNNQEPCYLIYTTPVTHKIILSNLNKSSMYGGLDDITGVGPRYCPSIEDKLTRFIDKEKHQLFLEPESMYYDDIYVQGFSTSMPEDIQEQMVHSLPGLENAKILKYAYAIEYDAIYPTQITASLETKVLKNLFTAGQINGTSGYEEAACQGLIAGINASLKVENKEPLILKRNEAYIGVLIDDLITKGTHEPYRMLTSRAEYRLLLRHDNADIRLREYGYKVGLIDEERHNKFKQKISDIESLKQYLKDTKITPTPEINEILNKLNSPILKDGITLYNLLKRSEITIDKLKENKLLESNYEKVVENQVEIQIKYEGYIIKTEREAEKMLKNEEKQIPNDIDYSKITNLASEARQKLEEIRPTSIGQALRISGVNPADISILMVYLRKNYNE